VAKRARAHSKPGKSIAGFSAHTHEKRYDTHARTTIVTITNTLTHDCKANGHNSGSECQNPRQLDRQTRQSMSNANRRLSAVQGKGRAYPDPSSASRFSLWPRSRARGLQQTSTGAKLIRFLATAATIRPDPVPCPARLHTRVERTARATKPLSECGCASSGRNQQKMRNWAPFWDNWNTAVPFSLDVWTSRQAVQQSATWTIRRP
jgi:hypothetical protein